MQQDMISYLKSIGFPYAIDATSYCIVANLVGPARYAGYCAGKVERSIWN
jgi:hypothetical protein